MPKRKPSLPEKIRRTLAERILAGKYKPGERLLELQIAGEFKTSQGSVREALRQLEASRLVESKPYQGTRVRGMSPREMHDAYMVRAVLEQAAAPGAAKAFKGNVERLQVEVNAVLAACITGDLSAQAKHVYTIHRMIVEASGNEVLLRVWESLSLETRVRIRLDWAKVDPEQVAASYEKILTALERGDDHTTGLLLRQHAEAFAPSTVE
jgi:DNA-binding GntR family transcriptional regulator